VLCVCVLCALFTGRSVSVGLGLGIYHTNTHTHTNAHSLCFTHTLNLSIFSLTLALSPVLIFASSRLRFLNLCLPFSPPLCGNHHLPAMRSSVSLLWCSIPSKSTLATKPR
jgi:hypothetical protein